MNLNYHLSMATEKLTPHITGEISPSKRSARDGQDTDQDAADYCYSEQSKKAINSLKKAHADKDLKAADLIIADMVEKSLVILVCILK